MGAEYITSDYTSAYCQPLETQSLGDKVSVVLFPNRTNSILTVQSSFNIESFEIFNSLGLLVYKNFEKKLGTFSQIDVLELPSGIYSLKIKSGSESMLTFIKQ